MSENAMENYALEPHLQPRTPGEELNLRMPQESLTKVLAL